MNSSQRLALDRLHEQAGSGHAFGSRTNPAHELVRCSCGWSHAEHRNQNALARSSKMNAAIRKHLEEVISRVGGTK